MTEALRKGQEGSRWWNERPSSTDVATWFETVPIHEGLTHGRYIGGIVLIPQKAKVDEIVGYDERGVPKILENVQHLTFTPYPKVETRVQYFHDLMALHPDWMGVIEPIGGGQGGLPPGFFGRVVGTGDKQASFVCCTMRVRVYDREDYTETASRNPGGESIIIRTGKTIIDAPPATKMASALDRWGKPDPFSMMKAETGAVGRALGMAGMLVVPGAGVATADDLQEAAQATTPGLEPAGGAEQAPPPTEEQPAAAEADEPPDENVLRQEAAEAIAILREEYPEAYQTFAAWSTERGIQGVGETSGVALRGLVKKVQKDLDAARKAAIEDDANAG